MYTRFAMHVRCKNFCQCKAKYNAPVNVNTGRAHSGRDGDGEG